MYREEIKDYLRLYIVLSAAIATGVVGGLWLWFALLV
jgi:hypothetical protein